MSTGRPQRLAVLGGGSWGTALAQAAALAGCGEVTLWMRDRRLAEAIASARENSAYLPGLTLDPAIRPTTEVAAIADAEAVLIALPAQSVRSTVPAFAAFVRPDRPLVCCAKGIETGTGLLMSEVLGELLPEATHAVLSGPSFAGELARGLPTAVTLAAADIGVAERLVAMLGSRAFRPYASSDPVGAEVGGAVKNVLAIACGIAEGHGFGENTRAALITRGIAETGRFAAALGGRPETLMGLSGIGDIALSCTSRKSRNYAFGVRLGAGDPVGTALGGTTVEGVHTAGAVVARAAALGIEMPIAAAVDAVLRGEAGVADMVGRLLARPLGREGWS